MFPCFDSFPDVTCILYQGVFLLFTITIHAPSYIARETTSRRIWPLHKLFCWPYLDFVQLDLLSPSLQRETDILLFSNNGLISYCFYTLNRWLIFFTHVLQMTIFTDSLAMLIGRPFGKTKMFPALSPKKSWEGFLGGIVCGSIGFMCILYFPFVGRWSAIPTLQPIPMFIVALCVGIVCQFGDLTQSYFKRVATIKESGVFFPGHGGALDRICSSLLASQLLYLVSDYIVDHYSLP